MHSGATEEWGCAGSGWLLGRTMRFVTYLQPAHDYDQGGLMVQRDIWTPPAFAMLIHVLSLAACKVPVMGLEPASEWAMGKAREMGHR